MGILYGVIYPAINNAMLKGFRQTLQVVTRRHMNMVTIYTE